MLEIDEKCERLVRLCARHGAAGFVLTTQANFAWITGGRTNRIDGTQEAGAGSILVTAAGERFVIANEIEMPRLAGEALSGLGFEPLAYPWTDDHAGPDPVVRLAAAAAGGSKPIAADLPRAGALPLPREVVRARAALVPAEIDRYRRLGRDVGRVVGDLCRRVEPGCSEADAARLAADAVNRVGARMSVVLAAADDRIARYRHPVPTGLPWRQRLLLVVCAEREGLVVALSRFVCAGAVPGDLAARTAAAASVFERLLEGTRAGSLGRDLFGVAAGAYRDAGFPGEERRHHQGGAIGYRAREWVAHPLSEERVEPNQAFAWNPSITGTKVEDTVLLVDGAIENITATDDWPSISIAVRGQLLPAPAILSL